MQGPMKILGAGVGMLQHCTEKLVTWPRHTQWDQAGIFIFVVTVVDCSSVGPWQVTQESDLVYSHSAQNLRSKILRDPHHETRLTLLC